MYYKDYIDGYSSMAMPLYELTGKDVNIPVEWEKNPKKYEDAVNDLKAALSSSPCLKPLNSKRKFGLVVDACRIGYG
jgi:hypothetical protein